MTRIRWHLLMLAVRLGRMVRRRQRARYIFDARRGR